MGSTSSSHLQNLEISHKPVYETLEYDLYDAHDGYKKLSLFHFKLNSDPDLIDFTAWKSIRHPLIIQYLDHGVVKGKKFVLTEYVEPVVRIISRLEPEEIICGISDILNALDFLHKRCLLSHNNVSPKSLFYSKKTTSSWKLGCTQLMSSPDEETFDFVKRMVIYKQLNSTHNFLPQEDLSPEICQPIPSVKEIHRRDSFSIGCLIEQFLPDYKESYDLVKRLKSAKKDLRPEPGPLRSTEHIFTGCHFLTFKESLIAFGSYSEDEKKNFVTTEAVAMIRKISEDLLASKGIPMLLTNRLVMLHPESRHALHAHLFVPENREHESISRHLIPLSLFEIHVIPVIVKLYSVRKIKLRLILLQYLQYYANLVHRDVVLDVLVPQISLGFDDENDDILAATFAAISTLVRVFGGDILKSSKKRRRKIFSNDIPRSSLSLSSQSEAVYMRSSITSVPLPPEVQISKHQSNRSNEPNTSLERSDEWQGDWGSSQSSSPSPATGNHNHYPMEESKADPNSTASNGVHKESAVPLMTSSSVNDQKLAKLWKKKPGAHNIDIKEIEIQVPEEVEDLFSEMEPRVNFAAKAAHNKNSSVNSYSIEEGSSANMFALREVQDEDGDEGGWSNDDEEWAVDQSDALTSEKQASAAAVFESA